MIRPGRLGNGSKRLTTICGTRSTPLPLLMIHQLFLTMKKSFHAEAKPKSVGNGFLLSLAVKLEQHVPVSTAIFPMYAMIVKKNLVSTRYLWLCQNKRHSLRRSA